ncbi:MAG TPA: YCF48-related protein [Dehalococcoidia bacterium]|nr:YCF48-related protein [Dehalococcoidia bacterium]
MTKLDSGAHLPGGGYLRSISFLDSDTGWLSTSRGGLAKTTDGGRSWEGVDLKASLEWEWAPEGVSGVEFFTELIGVASPYRGPGILAVTHDGGETWTQIFPPLES